MENVKKPATIKSVNLEDSDYAEIGKYTLISDVDKEKLFAFKVILCDNEVDRDFENFSTDALKGLAELFVGKTGIKDHSMRSNDQFARIYKTEVVVDDNKMTSYGEPYAQLVARAYMVRTEKNADLITEIEMGIKKEVSVACAMAESICSICSNDMRQHRCNHVLGKEYNGKRCSAVLNKPIDAYEWSFVAVPAQRAAGTSKGSSDFEERQPYPSPESNNTTNKSVLSTLINALNNMSKKTEV